MSDNSFFKDQSALTAAKTKVYEDYIKGYLPKLLLTFEKVYFADLFCGPGKNGNKNGSPLVLIESLNYILSSEQLKAKKNLKVYILFNDENLANIANLNLELDKAQFDRNVINIKVENKKYEELMPEIFQKLEKITLPKFFFLDPFTYSNVKMEDLKKLISLSNSEVLLFIPIFHTYRFSNANLDESHLTRKFIEQFTEDGMTDYQNIHCFMNSVREKLLKTIGVPYIRPVLLDGGGSKNSLFLLTKHQAGMLLMNKVAFILTDDGNSFLVKNKGMISLFNINELSTFYLDFFNKLKNEISNRDLTNGEIVDMTIKNGFLPRHAKKMLEDLHSNKKIVVFSENDVEIKDNRKWNVAENITITTIFKWLK